jgi:hypothetical protein
MDGNNILKGTLGHSLNTFPTGGAMSNGLKEQLYPSCLL